MLPDKETAAAVVRQMVAALADHCDHAELTENGTLFVVQDGFWWELAPRQLDNGE